MVSLRFEDGIDVGIDDSVGLDVVCADVGFDVGSFGLRSGMSAYVSNHFANFLSMFLLLQRLHPISSEPV